MKFDLMLLGGIVVMLVLTDVATFGLSARDARRRARARKEWL